MGDRANVYVHDGRKPGVYLYTHWAGTELPETVRVALERGEDRWDDEAYLTRVIFSTMIADDVDSVTGYGISASVGDGDDRVVDVDVEAGEVALVLNGRYVLSEPFRAFVEAAPARW